MIKPRYLGITGRVLGPTGRWQLRRVDGGEWCLWVEIRWAYCDMEDAAWVSEHDVKFEEVFEYDRYADMRRADEADNVR